jgi:hypothetical protein
VEARGSPSVCVTGDLFRHTFNLGARGPRRTGGTPMAPAHRRISNAGDEDQTEVDRQQRLCREVAERLRLIIGPGLCVCRQQPLSLDAPANFR